MQIDSRIEEIVERAVKKALDSLERKLDKRLMELSRPYQTAVQKAVDAAQRAMMDELRRARDEQGEKDRNTEGMLKTIENNRQELNRLRNQIEDLTMQSKQMQARLEKIQDQLMKIIADVSAMRTGGVKQR